ASASMNSCRGWRAIAMTARHLRMTVTTIRQKASEKSTRQSTISNAPAGRSSRKYAGNAPHIAKAATAKKMPERSRADAAAGLGVAEGILKTLLRSFGPEEPRRPARFPGRAFGEELLANDHGEHVASRENEKVLSAVLDLGSAVLGVDDLVANRDVERNAVAIVVDAAWAYCDDLALLEIGRA